MSTFLILFAICLLCSCCGWKKLVYTLSIGYGYSVAACGLAMTIINLKTLTLPSILLCVLLMAYGLRLGTFTMMRMFRNASYKKKMPELTKTSRPITPVMTFSVWVSCALLYVMEVSPVLFRTDNIAADLEVSNLWGYIGAAIMAAGLVLEAGSDAQKSAAKKIRPDRFVDTGLFKIVRCPNYLGEIIFWTGCFLSGAGSNHSALQWIVSAVGYICIVYIMFGGARRLEIRQNKAYGNDPEYQKYVRRVPIILPLVPLYTVEKYTWLKG